MAWTEIAQMTAPVAGAFEFQGLDLSAWELVEIICTGIKVQTDASIMKVLLYKGSSTAITSYDHHTSVLPTSTTEQEEANTNIAYAPMCIIGGSTYQVGNASDEGWNGKILLPHPTLSGVNRLLTTVGSYVNPSGVGCRFDGGAKAGDSGAITGFKLFATSDLTAGKVVFMGMNTS